MGNATDVLVTTWIHHSTSALPEWIAHHRTLGVTRFHVFHPDNAEDAPGLLAALRDAGEITTTPIACDASESGEQIRNAAIRAAEMEREGSSGWGLFLGYDEYLLLYRHDTLKAMLDDHDGMDALTAPVRLVPACRDRGHEPGPVLAGATHFARDKLSPLEWRTLVRQGIWANRLPGYPVGKPKDRAKPVTWLNGAGRPMPEPWANHAWQRTAAANADDLIAVARIPAPSVETLLLRAAYAHPAKSQPMPSDLLPALDAEVGTPIPEAAFVRHAADREAELARILKHSGVAHAQQAQGDEERRRIRKQSRRQKLWIAINKYLDGGPLPSEDQKADLTPDQGLTPAPAAAAPPPAAKAADPPSAAPEPVSKHQREPALLNAAPVKEHPGVPDAFARVATDPPPAWFAEIYPGGGRQGFLTSLEHHSLVYIERDPDTLIVSFDNISNVHDISFGRAPWAYKFVHDAGHSHLAIIARRKDWYRDPQLIGELQGLADRGFFARFKKVVMTGTSMGGFGALTFSSLSPGCIVLAYSPQSTLDRELVPWEERFGMGRDRNWSLPFSDAAFEIAEAKQVFVVYDPFFEPDKRHIERLQEANVTPLKAWFSGHFSAVFIRRANLIKPLFEHVIDETLTEHSYYKLLRSRRTLQWYRKALEERALERHHAQLATRVGPAFRRNQRKILQKA